MEKIRYGVIGIKGIGQVHAYLAQKHKRVELTALVDIDADFVNKKSQELGVRGFTDYRDMLKAGIVDAVSIATPHYLHGKMGLDCLNAGVHIFLEKPLANRVSEADDLLAVAQANNLKICVGHQYRTHRSPQAMKHLVDTRAIGKIMRVLWTWNEFRSEGYYTRDIWRATWQHAGGGVLMNQVSHDLDLICWIIGQPVQVSALIGNQLHNTSVEDIACVNVLFANGAFGSFQFTINQPRGYSVRQIAGDNGIIVTSDVKSLVTDQDDQILFGTYEDTLPTMADELIDHHAQPKISWQTVKLPNNRTIWKRAKRKFSQVVLRKSVQRQLIGHPALMHSFINAIIKDKKPMVSGADSLPAVELINAIVLSAMRRKTVDLPLNREEYDQLFKELCHNQTRVTRFDFRS